MDREVKFQGYSPELLQAFQVAEEHPLRKGLFQILQDAANVEASLVSNAGLTDSQRHFYAGRLGMIQDLHQGFEALFQEAHAGSGEQNPPTP